MATSASVQIEAALDDWVKVGTWHTIHPADDERFHRATKKAFDLIRRAIPFDEARDAITNVVNHRHPGMSTQQPIMDHIESKARAIEQIGDYLHDNGLL